MSADELPDISPEEFFEITISLQGERASLVGGQALNLWAEYYYTRVPGELAEFAPYTSKDVDYFGFKDAAYALAQKLGGTVRIPSIEDQTASTALVEVDIHGRTIGIDFISDVLGVSHKALEKGHVAMTFPFSREGLEYELEVVLLAPHLVMQSRTANVVKLGRTTGLGLRQLRASIIITREYILERLSEGDRRGATKVVKENDFLLALFDIFLLFMLQITEKYINLDFFNRPCSQ